MTDAELVRIFFCLEMMLFRFEIRLSARDIFVTANAFIPATMEMKNTEKERKCAE
jgi:hypothetical protein